MTESRNDGERVKSAPYPAYLKVVFVDLHLEIQSRELAQVAVRERVLRSKDRSNRKHTREISHDCHLFVELGGLGQTSILPIIL